MSSAATAAGPELHVTDLLELNSLTGKGKTPFHLAMEFQLYDLEGKASEQGSLEEWWTESDGSSLLISTPSLGTRHSLRLDGLPDDAARRSLYLIGELMRGTLAPANRSGLTLTGVKSQEKSFGPVKLHCVTPEIMGPKGPASLQQTFCTDATDTVRLISGLDDVFVRDRPAVFHGTKVPLNGGLMYSGRRAITGTVTKLESFDPAHSPVALEKGSVDPAAGATDEPGANRVIPGVVLAGELVKREQPEYPEQAKRLRLSGAVLLHAVISAQGSIESLFPIASPSEILTYAAMTAVNKWRYRPYVLNGTATAVDTTVVVNYYLR